MNQLMLYTTSHCHLCEQAERLLLELKDQFNLEWLCVEISTDDILMAKYGTTIPVIKDCKNQTEINWPFTKQDIINLVSN